MYFNPRPPCGGRRALVESGRPGKSISIHAPRAGGDHDGDDISQRFGISIHAPRAGGDRVTSAVRASLIKFQSTPPVRGATRIAAEQAKIDSIFQSTPPVRGATYRAKVTVGKDIFQSTPPVRGATKGDKGDTGAAGDFNPRPPCGGRHGSKGRTRPHGHFNPRPPCGGRLLKFESLFGFSNNSCMVIRFLAAPSSLL